MESEWKEEEREGREIGKEERERREGKWMKACEKEGRHC